MTTFVTFTPSTTTPFSFQATLSDGNQYTIGVPWNIVRAGWYVNVTDINGDLIVNRGLSGSGPILQAALTWAEGIATAVCTTNHNVPLCRLANIRIANTGTSFDGFFLGLSTGLTTLTYPLAVDPQESLPQQAQLDFPLNLLEGYETSPLLLFHSETLQFEF